MSSFFEIWTGFRPVGSTDFFFNFFWLKMGCRNIINYVLLRSSLALLEIQSVPEKLSLEGTPLLVDKVMCRRSAPDFMPSYVVNLSKLDQLTLSASHNQLMVSTSHHQLTQNDYSIYRYILTRTNALPQCI